MRRRTTLALPALLLPKSAAAQALSAADRADIARAEGWLNNLRTIKARFLQIAQGGAAAEGTAWISRPGRMRFEYDPPEPLLLVAAHGQFFFFDKAMKQATTLPLGATPLGILLRENLRLSGEVTVSRVERGGGLVGITLFRTGAAAEGRLTLVFSDQPTELKQWVVVDAQARGNAREPLPARVRRALPQPVVRLQRPALPRGAGHTVTAGQPCATTPPLRP
jgi:outer membrane lipoprotein-sorting protein